MYIVKIVHSYIDIYTCDKHSLRKSYLALYDILEQFLWNISLYLEKCSIEKKEATIRLKKVILDKMICEPMGNRRLFKGRPNLRMQLIKPAKRDNN